MLHDAKSIVGETWAHFVEHFGIDGIDVRRGAFFTQMDMVLQAAIDGQGVALARSQLVIDDLRAGRLIRPFEVEKLAPMAYYFVCREESLRSTRSLCCVTDSEEVRRTAIPEILSDVKRTGDVQVGFKLE